ncbi:hypothetical protein B0O80DRAFT_469591, partial [Mortierella sp. GBAus27b]
MSPERTPVLQTVFGIVPIRLVCWLLVCWLLVCWCTRGLQGWKGEEKEPWVWEEKGEVQRLDKPPPLHLMQSSQAMLGSIHFESV